MHDSMVIWWYQMIGGEIRLIDHLEQEGMPLTEALTIVKERKDNAGRLYAYKTHNFPHDLNTTELLYGHNRQDITRKELRGFGSVKIVEKRSVEDGIELCRRIFPSCFFDSVRTSPGIDMLSLYRKKFDDKLDTYVKARKDFSSHSADAFRTLAVGLAHRVSMQKPKPNAEYFDDSLPIEDIMRHHGGPGGTYFPGSLSGHGDEFDS